MKKLTLLIFAILTIIFFSCRKDMTCNCDTTTDYSAPSGSGKVVSNNTKTLLNVTKSEGRVNCLSQKYSFTHYTILGDSVTETKISCTLN